MVDEKCHLELRLQISFGRMERHYKEGYEDHLEFEEKAGVGRE